MPRTKLSLLALCGAMLAITAVAHAKTIKVGPGDSIQAAVDAAKPGDTVRIAPGTYTETSTPCVSEPGNDCAVVVDKDGIKIVGSSGHGGVVLQASGGQDVGINVGNNGDPGCLGDPDLRVNGSLISGITVQGFADDGVLLYCVDGWRVTGVAAKDNAEYGIFPSHSFNGRVDHSFTSGANDTGFYIGQSSDSRMDHNLATDNVSGYEIENSTGVRADHNEATGNTGGILSFTLPFLDKKVNDGNRIDHNSVHANNRPNTCLEPGDSVCQVPSGTGILLVAADDNVVEHNDVRGNNSFGIAVSNICVSLNLPPAVCAALDIDPNPDGNSVIHNVALQNGHDPDPALPPVFAVDLAWDLTGTGNCWSKNVFDTSFPDPLPSC